MSSHTDVTIGLWREGKNLVIERGNAVFPLRCLWSNEPVAGEHSMLRVQHHSIIGWRISVWRGFHQEWSTIRRADLVVPISEGWKGARDARIAAMGRLILWIGISLWVPILLFVIFISLYRPPPNDSLAMFLSVAVAILGTPAIVCTVVGLAWPYIELPVSKDSPINVPFIDDNYVWISDVHPAYLEVLPEFKGTPLQKCIPQKVSLIGAIKRDYVHLLLIVGLVLVTGATAIMISR